MLCNASHFPQESHSLESASSIDLATYKCEYGTPISCMKKLEVRQTC
jgi:hypothetical protein